MKPEKQVCTFEQAKRLKELGIRPTEALFVFYNDDDGSETLCCRSVFVDLLKDAILSDLTEAAGSPGQYRYNEKKLLSVAEDAYSKAIGEDEMEVFAALTVAELGVMLAPLRHNPPGESEAVARAAFLIRRLETGKTTAAECNQRLTDQY
jgi:hypothetical protein